MKAFASKIAVALLSLALIACDKEPAISEKGFLQKQADGTVVDVRKGIFAESFYYKIYRRKFAAILLVSDSPETIVSWRKKKDGNELFTGPMRALKWEIQSGKKIYAAVYFAGPGVDKNGMSNLKADFVVKDPRGGLFTVRRNAVLFQGKNAPKRPMYQVGKQFLEIDTKRRRGVPGVYLVEATVKDMTNGMSMKLRYDFKLVP